MRKYLEVAKIYLKQQLIWRADTVFQLTILVTKILFAYLLWGAIFGKEQEVAGFTFSAMLSYYIISSFLSIIDTSGEIGQDISGRIRNGTFSSYMILPMGTLRFYIARQLGTTVFYGACILSALILWMVLFPVGFVLTGNWQIILAVLVLIGIGMLFMVQLNYFLGILTFRFQEISTFLMIKDNLIALITGTLVPLVLLPESIIVVMKFFPFYYVTYLPSMALIGRCQDEVYTGIVVLAAWSLLFALLNRVFFGRYRIKYDGVGI
ncbi:ABC transporter permease [uncultured Robinsoniella sp.]|uniref:ABC transporter permease n=1 Tax=uncultured Robinsoniella sp. TaxID=904190 RepID=UPI00374E4BE4